MKELIIDEHLFAIKGMVLLYIDLVNYLVGKILPNYMNRAKRDKLKCEAKYYAWDDPYLYKYYADQIIRRCVPNDETPSILTLCHAYAWGGHFGPKRMARKVLDSGFYWPTLFHDAYIFCKNYE